MFCFYSAQHIFSMYLGSNLFKLASSLKDIHKYGNFKISIAPIKAKPQEPAYSQALKHNLGKTIYYASLGNAGYCILVIYVTLKLILSNILQRIQLLFHKNEISRYANVILRKTGTVD